MKAERVKQRHARSTILFDCLIEVLADTIPRVTQPDTSKASEYTERFTRWQGMAITQFGYAVNLILTFATASLGFLFTVVKDKDFVLSPCGRLICALSILCLGLSILFGLSCVMTRLYDFRTTKDIIKERRGKKRSAEIERLCTSADKLGRWTWRLFKFQVLTFGLGVAALIITFVVAYKTRLMP